MARVAEATCATCSHIKPRNEMREVSVNRKVGTRFGVSHSRHNTRESASVQYRRQMVWVCKGCRAPKSDGIIPWKTLMLIALVAVGFMWFADAGTKRKVARGVGNAISTVDTQVKSATKADEIATAPDADGDAKDTSATPDDGVPETRKEPVAAATIDWDGTEIAAARVKALDDGGSARWKADGAKGQVVVSSPTETDGTECRNAYSTARIDGEDVKSATTTWCRPDGGQWALR